MLVVDMKNGLIILILLKGKLSILEIYPITQDLLFIVMIIILII